MALEVIFLFVLALVWIVFAVVQDLKTREVANWLNFSLIIFALAFRFFWSLFDGSFAFFYQGLMGLGIFFVLGNALYYGRFFAGGDAKLMISLGAILPLSNYLLFNVQIFAIFLGIFLIAGAVYSLSMSAYLSIRNFKSFRKEFCRQFRKNKKLVFVSLFVGTIFFIFGFRESSLFSLGIFLAVFSQIYIYTKAVDEACMRKSVDVSNLTEGDWLYKDVKVGKKIIFAKWEGLSMDDIKEIRKKHKSVIIRQGIPFTPVFLISLLVLIWLWYSQILGKLFVLF
ncbi:MAG: prepilin peptidase [Nanoarchaeota archaeon]|nr:prepilin peptidase [Nanoarchaeota archaeon]